MKSPTKCAHSSISYWVMYKLTGWVETRIWLSLLSLLPCIILFYLRHLASTNWLITLSNRPPPCALVLIGWGPSPKLIGKRVSLCIRKTCLHLYTYSKAVGHWCNQGWRGSWNWIQIIGISCSKPILNLYVSYHSTNKKKKKKKKKRKLCCHFLHGVQFGACVGRISCIWYIVYFFLITGICFLFFIFFIIICFLTCYLIILALK